MSSTEGRRCSPNWWRNGISLQKWETNSDDVVLAASANVVRETQPPRKDPNKEMDVRKLDFDHPRFVSSVLVLVATVMLVKHNVHAKIFWNELVLEKITNFVMDQSKEQRILNSVSYNAVKGDPESVLNCIDKYCSQYEWAMNVGDEKGIILDKTVEEADPTVALEMGTYCGYSAIRIARLLKPNARLLTIEFNPEFIPIAKEIIEIAGLSDKVTIIEGHSQDVIPQLKKKYEVETLDFIFLDHWKERYAPDTILLEECGLLHKGSILLADNIVYPGAPEFIKYIRSNSRYECTSYPTFLEYMKVEDAMEKAVYMG